MKKPKQKRYTAKKQAKMFNLFNKVLLWVVVVLTMVIVLMAGAYTYLFTQHQALSKQYQDFTQAAGHAFDNTVVWQMDDSCADQFAQSDKLLLTIQKADK